MEAREREPTAEPAAGPGAPALSAPVATIADRVLGLQRSAGNRAVGRLLARQANERRISRTELWRGVRIGGDSGSGGLDDDYGPGLYFSTSADVGRLYALQRAADDRSLAAVFGAEIPDQALGRVLDLTKHPRWQAYIDGPFDEDSITPVRKLLPPYQSNKRGAYPIFMEFVKREGINLNDYDAIKGPEWVRGGVQICVRSPVLATRIASVLTMVERGVQIPPWNSKTGFGGAPPPVLPASAKLDEKLFDPPARTEPSPPDAPLPAAIKAAPKGLPDIDLVPPANLKPAEVKAAPKGLPDIDLVPPANLKPAEVKAAPKGLPDIDLVPPPNLKPGPKGGDGGGAPPAAGGGVPPPPASPAGSGGAAPPAGSARSAMTASTPGWQVRPIATPLAPDAYGDAKSGAVGGAIDLLFAAYNRSNNALQREREEAERRRLQVEIDRVRDKHPDWGALLIVYKRQMEDPTRSSQGTLSPRFIGIAAGFGRDAREAEAQMGTSAFPGAAPTDHDYEASRVWIPALRPVDPPPPPPPFPPVRLATFTSGTPTLVDVIWALTPFGFDDRDDRGTLSLDVPPGVEPRFYVLELPARMKSAVPNVANPGFESGWIPQTTVGGLPVVRLDVYVPWDHDTAAAIFPADAATAAIFASVPATRYSNLLGVRDFDLVRWVDPDQISVIADRTVFELLER